MIFMRFGNWVTVDAQSFNWNDVVPNLVSSVVVSFINTPLIEANLNKLNTRARLVLRDGIGEAKDFGEMQLSKVSKHLTSPDDQFLLFAEFRPVYKIEKRIS